MALPLSFANSFWTPDFNVDPLWNKLQAGVTENQEILRFINVRSLSMYQAVEMTALTVILLLRCHQDRTNATQATARALYDAAEVKLSKNGFAKDDGASLRRTFEGGLASNNLTADLAPAQTDNERAFSYPQVRTEPTRNIRG